MIIIIYEGEEEETRPLGERNEKKTSTWVNHCVCQRR